jgi:glycosyltransferase involved in cell wall biosynthesis
VTFFFAINLPKNINTVIYSGIFSVLASRRQTALKKIYYCHTLPKFAIDSDFSRSWKKQIFRFILYIPIKIYWFFYVKSIREMDLIITNSAHTQRKIYLHTRLKSIVIHPPIDTQLFKWIRDGDYFISLARLEKNKQVDKIIKAFAEMPLRKLIIVSGGSEEENLKKLSKKSTNIYFTGWLPDNKLAELIGSCLATIYVPKDEDFGMSAIESLSSGKPVIGISSGGLKECISSKVGFLLPPDFSCNEMKKIIENTSYDIYQKMRSQCEAISKSYSEEIFFKQLLIEIERL